MRSRFGISMWVALILAALGSAGIASAAGTPRLDYGRDVRPILSENCFHCHGQDSKQRMANLRLDSEASLFADRGSYKIVVPGDLANSRLLARISAANKASRPQRGQHALVHEAAQDEDLGRPVLGPDEPRRLDPGQARHREIHDDATGASQLTLEEIFAR